MLIKTIEEIESKVGVVPDGYKNPALVYLCANIKEFDDDFSSYILAKSPYISNKVDHFRKSDPNHGITLNMSLNEAFKCVFDEVYALRTRYHNAGESEEKPGFYHKEDGGAGLSRIKRMSHHSHLYDEKRLMDIIFVESVLNGYSVVLSSVDRNTFGYGIRGGHEILNNLNKARSDNLYIVLEYIGSKDYYLSEWERAMLEGRLL